MSVHTADSQFSFQLPSLSYIDAKWEEPNLRGTAPRAVRKGGIAAWLSRQAAALVTWQRNSAAMNELAAMTDRELLDIGMNRADFARVFNPSLNQDLRQRGV
jgi:uncharacterized protein YjiS (DUF1127 family)